MDLKASINKSIFNKLLRENLPQFTDQVFRTVSPSSVYVPNWHINLICEYLLACQNREITRLIINMPPRFMKPLDVNAMVIYNYGMIKKLQDIEIGDQVLTHKGRYRKVINVHEQGLLPTIKIHTHSGREIISALDHPFLTPLGWVEAQNLKLEDVLAIIVPPDINNLADESLEEYRMAGYFIGDGQCGIYKNKSTEQYVQTANITCNDDLQGIDILYCVNKLGWKCNIKNNRYNINNGVRDWLKKVGLAGKTSKTKTVPDFVFKGNNESVANFIGAYFDCDGHITSKNKTNTTLSITSISKELLIGVQHLLVRFGINARIRCRENNNVNDKWRPLGYKYYSLEIGNCNDVEIFARVIPLKGCKKQKLINKNKRRTDFDKNILPDKIIGIYPHKPMECKCLTVEEDHSFTVYDIAVHNSITASVAFPAWLLGHDPKTQIMCASYGQRLSEKFSIDTRLVVTMPWFKNLFPQFELLDDQNTKAKFMTTERGFRIATSIGGAVTGAGADFLIIDDPLNADQANSTVALEGVNMWFDQVFSTRLNDPKRGVIIVIMQRLHENDLSGHLLAKETGWEHLKIPLIAEKTEIIKKNNFVKKREEGELLNPTRLGENEVNRLKAELGAYTFAGQYQQTPSPSGGGVFKREWLQYYDNLNLTALNKYIFVDPANAKKKTSDYTAVIIAGIGEDKNIYIIDMIRDRLDVKGREDLLFDLHKRYNPQQVIYEAYGMQCDSSWIKYAMEKRNYRFALTEVGGKLDKVSRISRLDALFARGQIWLPRTLYKTNYENKLINLTEAFIQEEYLPFPVGLHDDMLDAMARMLDITMLPPGNGSFDYYKFYS